VRRDDGGGKGQFYTIEISTRATAGGIWTARTRFSFRARKRVSVAIPDPAFRRDARSVSFLFAFILVTTALIVKRKKKNFVVSHHSG